MTDPSEIWSELLKQGAALQERAQAGARAFKDIGDVKVGLLEKECVYAENKIRLYRYTPLARSAGLPPLLICSAMVNRPYMLDLQPDRSLIRELLFLGLDVYLVDWGYPDGADRFIPLEEYICGYLKRCVDTVLRAQRIEALDLLGVCQGGTFSLCFAALEPQRINKLIAMVTPVDFKTPENLLSKWVQHIDMDLLTQSGNVSGELLNTLFLALMPFRLTQQKYVHLLQHPSDRAQMENFMRMEKWIFDSPDQPARACSEFVKWFFQENRLIKNELVLNETPVRLDNIRCPLLNIYAARDHLVPPSASIPLGARVGSAVYEALEVDVGHIGIYVSGKAKEKVPRALFSWLKS